jgi:MoaA/NifB/PqqE/SkfB family radical SAM enzyme
VTHIAVPEITADSPLRSVSPGLTSVDVYITSQCNRRCTYCFLTSDFLDSRTRMGIDTYGQILSWSRRHRIGEITLLGGEPSLHPDFAKMVGMARDEGMQVRIVTNGNRKFRRLVSSREIGADQVSRVAVSLDSLDGSTQDRLRGSAAWQDAHETIELLRTNQIPFDINVTALKPVLSSLDEMIDFAAEAGCRRLNIHWPSAIGIGRELPADQLPNRHEWLELVDKIEKRVEKWPGFFIEIERGFLSDGQELSGCALNDFSNIEIFPDGRTYRCGLLVDRPEMASLSFADGNLTYSQPHAGEQQLASLPVSACASCPALAAGDRRACIYDKVSSRPLP